MTELLVILALVLVYLAWTGVVVFAALLPLVTLLLNLTWRRTATYQARQIRKQIEQGEHHGRHFTDQRR